MERIKKIVEECFGLDLNINSRELKYVEARACFYVLCREIKGATFKNIADCVNKHHSTILHAIKEFPEMCRLNKSLLFKYKYIYKRLNKIYQKPESMTISEIIFKYNSLILENIKLRDEISKLQRNQKALLKQIK
ncbi:MAG: hypothetical protein Unbinned5858contig1001_18 [Prokaryotic dsDNA virus sp.]|nr:MAG: hypothetical protein Unbinned5858contig1001_18 [Prokaryotic dsDNA virus sp.]|tara:strand:- start:8382 stop:8786 length:405 start_codon:yes stop_codon:yes gene_type:complete